MAASGSFWSPWAITTSSATRLSLVTLSPATTFLGINVNGGFGGADGNSLDVRIKDNTVTDNGIGGIRVIAGQDNSSNNHVVARIHGNTVERTPVCRYRGRGRRGRGGLPDRHQ